MGLALMTCLTDHRELPAHDMSQFGVPVRSLCPGMVQSCVTRPGDGAGSDGYAPSAQGTLLALA